MFEYQVILKFEQCVKLSGSRGRVLAVGDAHLGSRPTFCHPTQTQQKLSNCRLSVHIVWIDTSRCLCCSTGMYSWQGLQSHTMFMFLIQYSWSVYSFRIWPMPRHCQAPGLKSTLKDVAKAFSIHLMSLMSYRGLRRLWQYYWPLWTNKTEWLLLMTSSRATLKLWWKLMSWEIHSLHIVSIQSEGDLSWSNRKRWPFKSRILATYLQCYPHQK